MIYVEGVRAHPGVEAALLDAEALQPIGPRDQFQDRILQAAGAPQRRTPDLARPADAIEQHRLGFAALAQREREIARVGRDAGVRREERGSVQGQVDRPHGRRTALRTMRRPAPSASARKSSVRENP